MEPVRVPYEIQGRVGPMYGLFIFTRRHYSANVRYQAAAGPVDNGNGNAGPYTADGRRIVFTQWVQIHVRRGRMRLGYFLLCSSFNFSKNGRNGSRDSIH